MEEDEEGRMVGLSIYSDMGSVFKCIAFNYPSHRDRVVALSVEVRSFM